MLLFSPSLICASIQKAESEPWPSAEPCQLGTCYTQPENGPGFCCGCRLRVAGSGMGKTRFCPPSTLEVSSIQSTKDILWGFLPENVSKNHFLVVSPWPSKNIFFLERSFRGCVLFTGRYHQREIFKGLTKAAVFVSHAPKGFFCFEMKN